MAVWGHGAYAPSSSILQSSLLTFCQKLCQTCSERTNTYFYKYNRILKDKDVARTTDAVRNTAFHFPAQPRRLGVQVHGVGGSNPSTSTSTTVSRSLLVLHHNNYVSNID
eukprot:scpid42813/ scgid35611/ 